MSGRRAADPGGRASRAGARLRVLTAGILPLAPRRLLRDRGLAACLALLVAVSALLAAGAPALVTRILDADVRERVAAAGSTADVVLRAPLGRTQEGGSVEPEDVVALADALPAQLPSALARAADGITSAVLTPGTLATGPLTVGAQPDGSGGSTGDGGGAPATPAVRVALLTPSLAADLRVVDGAMPGTESDADADAEPGPRIGTSSDGPVDVAVSSAAAEAAGLVVGSALTVAQGGADRIDGRAPLLGIRVVGIVEAAPGTSLPDLPGLLAPVAAGDRTPGSTAGITVVAAADGFELARTADLADGDGVIRVRLDPAAFTDQGARAVVRDVQRLAAGTAPVGVDGAEVGGSAAPLQVTSGLDRVVAGHDDAARAAVAQMSVLLAGALGVAAVVLVLLARLLVGRRREDIARDRARGAGTTAVALTAGVESVLLAVVGGAAGLGAAVLLGVPWPLADPAPVVLLIAVAALAPPAEAAWIARRSGDAGRREVGRAGRVDARRTARIRRLVAEALVVVLAIAAVVAARGRGLLDARADGVDPLLAAAPLLLAAAATLVAVRAIPPALAALAAVARRGRGALGAVAGATGSPASPLPLGVLTLAVAVALTGGLLAETVATGRVAASWQAVGADARVDAEVPDADVAGLRDAPGVTAAGSARVTDDALLADGPVQAFATLLAVDAGYADALAAIPADADAVDPLNADRIRALADEPAEDDRLPVLVDRALADRLVTDDPVLTFGERNVRVRVAGVIADGPRGYLGGPFVIVDRGALAYWAGEPIVADQVLVTGPGAVAAVAALDVDPADVLTRDTWQAERSTGALAGGVDLVLALATAAAGILAALALLATAVAGAGRRARTLALLRTLGLPRRGGIPLAVAELAPAVLAALVGGAVAAVVTVLALGPALGLRLLTGGRADPPPSIAPAVVLAVAGAALLLTGLAILAEAAAHRHDRLAAVLREGDAA
ncbi:putative ABC transport system permease protein [Clavibacter michiganensis]|uniref:hypothetical protein n=1 Tax=Clavibacter michiganensis TaxID=28447 RepID=UPI001AE5AFF0|nr:hypothetical protein [Clavibacter michiganensis]MBP2456438.1 putative ABC transport system permease protein [Clavibacter michiganensis]MDQ0409008.1 putative ABC transport system permease protein [Clavibacter michiganensis]